MGAAWIAPFPWEPRGYSPCCGGCTAILDRADRAREGRGGGGASKEEARVPGRGGASCGPEIHGLM